MQNQPEINGMRCIIGLGELIKTRKERLRIAVKGELGLYYSINSGYSS